MGSICISRRYIPLNGPFLLPWLSNNALDSLQLATLLSLSRHRLQVFQFFQKVSFITSNQFPTSNLDRPFPFRPHIHPLFLTNKDCASVIAFFTNQPSVTNPSKTRSNYSTRKWAFPVLSSPVQNTDKSIEMRLQERRALERIRK